MPELESLRGLAALVVLLGHCYQLTQTAIALEEGRQPTATLSALGLVLDPQPAVLLFFVISGLVLSFQLRNEAPSTSGYAAFVVRRAFRLLPPLWASIAFTTALLVWAWPDVLNIPMTLQSIFLLAPGWNVVLWSLHAEFYCGLAFPILFFLSRRAGLPGTVLIAASLVPLMWLPVLGPELAVQFLVFFQIGIVAASAGDRLLAFTGVRTARILFVIAVAVYVAAPSVAAGPERTLALGRWANWMWLEIPACFFIVWFVTYARAGAVSSILSSWPARFYGRISFGTYLVHWPVLLIVLVSTRGFVGDLGQLYTIVVVAVVLALSTTLSIASYRFIEVPFNSLGRELANRLRRRIEQARLEGITPAGLVLGVSSQEAP